MVASSQTANLSHVALTATDVATIRDARPWRYTSVAAEVGQSVPVGIPFPVAVTWHRGTRVICNLHCITDGGTVRVVGE